MNLNINFDVTGHSFLHSRENLSFTQNCIILICITNLQYFQSQRSSILVITQTVSFVHWHVLFVQRFESTSIAVSSSFHWIGYQGPATSYCLVVFLNVK